MLESKTFCFSRLTNRHNQTFTRASMPIRGLEGFLKEKKLINTENLSALENARIGIEGNQWVRNLPLSEPFQIAMGGVPLTLQSVISRELDHFKKRNIKPVFVWNGLNIPKKDRPSPGNLDPRTINRNNAWEAYFAGNFQRASELFQSEKYVATNFINNIIKYFYEKKVESFRAPYYAWAQLYYFLVGSKPYPTSYIHAVYGGLELLLFGAPTVILNINFEQNVFTWVNLNQILESLKLTHEQFVDAALLAGLPNFEMPTFPPIDERNFSFKAAYDLISTFKSGYAAIQNAVNPKFDKSRYLEDFLRAKARIQNHPIFDTHATCVSLNKEFCPRDLHEIIGFRLPDEVYWLMSQSVISPQVVNNLISGILLETPPLLDSEEYRKTLSGLLPIRTKTLGLLSTCLTSEFKTKKVITLRWYDGSEIEMDHLQAAIDLRNFQTAILTEEEIKTEYQRRTKPLTEWIDIGFVIQLQVHKFHSKTSLISTNEDKTQKSKSVSTINELLATILLHALEIREYLENKSYRPTHWGRALALVNDRFVHESLCVLELLRLGQLHGQPLKTIPSHTSEPYDNEREVNLLTRIFSLLPVSMEEGRSWDGPIDHDLLGFNSIVKALYRTLRNLLEMILTNLFLSGRTALKPEEYLEVSNRLPYFEEANTAMGLVLKSFLVEQNTDLKQRFPNCTNPIDDLKRGIQFWDEVMKMIEFLNQENVEMLPKQLYIDFKNADTLLKTHWSRLESDLNQEHK